MKMRYFGPSLSKVLFDVDPCSQHPKLHGIGRVLFFGFLKGRSVDMAVSTLLSYPEPHPSL